MEKKQRKEKKETSSVLLRNPLKNLNGVAIHKPKIKKSSNPSSSSCGEAQKVCSELLFSSKSSASSSSFSSSTSRTHLEKNSRVLPKTESFKPKKSTADASKVLSRSSENGIQRKPFLQKSSRSEPRCYKNSNKDVKSVGKNGSRLNISHVHGNPVNKLKKGAEEIQIKVKNSRVSGLGNRSFKGVANRIAPNSAENCTPVGKLLSGSNLESGRFGDDKTLTEYSVYEKAKGNSANAVKTPPVEASISPEIQSQSHTKMPVLKSARGPVCYGAGHLLSGVTDKRKCRRRGSLKGGVEKGDLLNDNLLYIPLLGEATVNWHLSPSNEGCHEDQGSGSRNRSGQSRITVCDNAAVILDVLSSPSTLCGDKSEVLSAGMSYSNSGSLGSVGKTRRNNSMKSLLVISPTDTCSFDRNSSNEKDHFCNNPCGDHSALSVSSRPDLDYSSDMCAGTSRVDIHDCTSVPTELNSLKETLEGMNALPNHEMSMLDPPATGLHFEDMVPSPCFCDPNNVDSISSWLSDATLDSLVPSHMRISWRDELISRTFETDEFDCCCLSDEQIIAKGPGGSAGKVEETYLSSNRKETTYLRFELGEDKENDLSPTDEFDCCCLSDEEIIAKGPGGSAGKVEETYLSSNRKETTNLRFELGEDKENDLSPMLLDYEPFIPARGKEKLSTHRPDTGAESICTEGGGLAVSDDSDWVYCHENDLFHD